MRRQRGVGRLHGTGNSRRTALGKRSANCTHYALCKALQETETKVVNSFEDNESNPETMKLVEAAKRREEEERRARGGFSPFQPHMSFSSGANPGTEGIPATASSESKSSPLGLYHLTSPRPGECRGPPTDTPRRGRSPHQ